MCHNFLTLSLCFASTFFFYLIIYLYRFIFLIIFYFIIDLVDLLTKYLWHFFVLQEVPKKTLYKGYIYL